MHCAQSFAWPSRLDTAAPQHSQRTVMRSNVETTLGRGGASLDEWMRFPHRPSSARDCDTRHSLETTFYEVAKPVEGQTVVSGVPRPG